MKGRGFLGFLVKGRRGSLGKERVVRVFVKRVFVKRTGILGFLWKERGFLWKKEGYLGFL